MVRLNAGQLEPGTSLALQLVIPPIAEPWLRSQAMIGLWFSGRAPLVRRELIGILSILIWFRERNSLLCLRGEMKKG
jgi:hypothetical protein